MIALLKHKALLLLLFCSAPLYAAPPFITDDADPANYRQVQVYPFTSLFNATHVTYLQAPALETDYGVVPNVELHLILPIGTYLQSQGGNSMGLSDTEFSIKYRFLTETTYRPEIVIVPTFELPTGNFYKNLGNGRIWYKLPIWIEKNWGPWTTYGGGGYVFNSALFMRTYKYGGWLLQRSINDKLALGAEIYMQGAITSATTLPGYQDTGPVTLINIGGNYNFSKTLSLLFSAGHSIANTKQWVGYFGLLWLINT